MLVILTPAAQLAAQSPQVRIAGRVHTQFSAAGGDSTAEYDPSAAPSSGFEIRRLRIEADVRIGERISMRLSPSFEMASLRLRDAFLRVALGDAGPAGIALVMGQEKKPLNRYSLTSSNNLPSIERGFRLRGFATTLAQNDLLEREGYTEHDIGASLELALGGGSAAVKAGVYNGSGESSADANHAKTFGARISGTPLRDARGRPLLRIGAAVVSRDRPVTEGPAGASFAPDSSRRTAAWGLDLEWGDFRRGLHVLADFSSGRALRDGPHCLDGTTPISCRVDAARNFGALRPGTPDSAFARFRSIQVIAAWRSPENAGRPVRAVEPALRLDYTDAGAGAPGDEAMLVTPALNLYFAESTVLRVGFDYYRYRAGGSGAAARVLRVAWQASF